MSKHINVEVFVERSGRPVDDDHCPGCGGPLLVRPLFEVRLAQTQCVVARRDDGSPIEGFCVGLNARKPS